MAEAQTELDAESVLMAAVLAPDVEEIDQAQADPALELDDPENLDAEGQEGEPTKEAKPQAESEEDYVEIPADEEGGEAQRLKVADLVASHKELQALSGQKAEIIERVEREATEHATVQLRTVEQYSRQAATAIQAAMQLLQPPQPPNPDMLDPSSQSYNPEGYYRADAQYRRSAMQFQQAQGLGNQLLQQTQQAQAQAAEVRDARELSRLNRAWPEFSQADTMNKFVDDMGKAYGFTPKELDDVLVDYRQALVARDALAYRAMKAQSGQVKAKVEAKAPKLVRSKQEAKGTSAQARDGKGKFVGDALANLKKTGSDEAAAAYFAGLSRAGRF